MNPPDLCCQWVQTYTCMHSRSIHTRSHVNIWLSHATPFLITQAHSAAGNVTSQQHQESHTNRFWIQSRSRNRFLHKDFPYRTLWQLMYSWLGSLTINVHMLALMRDALIHGSTSVWWPFGTLKPTLVLLKPSAAWNQIEYWPTLKAYMPFLPWSGKVNKRKKLT